ncbi:hypothetical protein [Enterococcus sp. CWB-B31]|nr:hypothetical protein [Enterococcus sp. CWB-B31]MCB5955008.1 hypothetical protein [Enterococcus sp. CWB-B31]
MKKRIIGLLMFGFSLIVSVSFVESVEAANYKEPAPTEIPTNDVEIVTYGLEDSDSIVMLSDGAVIHGEVEMRPSIDSNIVTVVNSDTDPQAITVEEFKDDPSKLVPKQKK